MASSSGASEDLISTTTAPSSSKVIDTTPVSSKTSKTNTPQRAIFQDLPTAYSSITARSSSATRQASSSSPPDAMEAHAQNLAAALGLKSPKSPLHEVVDTETPASSSAVSPAMQHQPESRTPRSPSPFISGNSLTSPTWMEKITKPFQRNTEASIAAEQSDTGADQAGRKGSATSTLRLSTYMPSVLKRGSVASQTAPLVGHGDSIEHDLRRYMTSPANSTTYGNDDTSSVYQTSLGGAPSSEADLSATVWSSPAGLNISNAEYAQVIDEQYYLGRKSHKGMGTVDEESQTTDTAFKTFDFVDQKPEVDHQASDKGKAPMRASRLETFDFGIRKVDEQPAGLTNKVSKPKSSETIVMSTSVSPFKTGPPKIPLPPHPPVNHYPPYHEQAHSSAWTVGGTSGGSSYGDTRVLLNMSQHMPSFNTSGSDAGSSESGRTESVSSNILALGDKDPNAGMGSSREYLTPYATSRPGSASSPSGKNSEGVAKLKVVRRQTFVREGEDDARPASMMVDSTPSNHLELDREIAAELRRVSRLSGFSNLSGSVVVLNEYPSKSNSGSSAKKSGPGEPQSSSSRDASSRPSDVSNDSGHGGSDPENQRGQAHKDHFVAGPKVTGKGSFAESLASTHASGVPRTSKDLHEEEEEGDWETVAGSGVPSRHGTRAALGHAVTGSSLADYSSYASLSPARTWSPFKDDEDIPVHPADDRYNHVFRTREQSPDGKKVKVPAYLYPDSNNFPHRNALTTPTAAAGPSNHQYQHPSPLPKSHVHPFKSSPPVIMDSGRKLPRAYDQIAPTPQGNGKGKVPAVDSPADPPVDPRWATGPPDDTITTKEYPWSDGQYGVEPVTEWDLERFGSPASHEGSEPSLNWFAAFTDVPLNPSHEDLPELNGSFAKATTLGPKVNITGTPNGTGMREVGSSLADASSPGQMFSSSPFPAPETPMSRMDPLSSPGASQVQTPSRARVRFGEGQSSASRSQPRTLYEQIRSRHEEVIGEDDDGVISRPKTAASILESQRAVKRTKSSRHGRTKRRVFPEPAINYVGASDQWFDPGTSFNQTPALPDPSEMDQYLGFEYRLYRPPRDSSSVRSVVCEQKRQMSRAVLAMCFLFPPLLIVYAYGHLDGAIASLTSGEITHFGRIEKRVAMWTGWIICSGVIAGIVVSMVVIAVLR
ncbi:MAG: hypothetical protein M1817_000304 [Caeruleum heppii]|nr:MAG: hypothetical protein M1817_000304 [Caeruleum heppii]